MKPLFLLLGIIFFISGCTTYDSTSGGEVSLFSGLPKDCLSILAIDLNTTEISRDDTLKVCYSAADEVYKDIPIDRDSERENCYQFWYFGDTAKSLLEEAQWICSPN